MKKILLLLAAAGFSHCGFSQAGMPVQSFGTNGVVRSDFGNPAQRSALAHLGNTVMYAPSRSIFTVTEINGTATITKWTASGVIDTAYGKKGYSTGVRILLPDGHMQADGKIIITGYASGTLTSIDFAAARFDTAGNLDPTFGAGGKVITPAAPGTSADFAWAAALQPDGKLVIAGSANNESTPIGAVARYLPDGSLDPSFGTAGVVTVPVGTADANFYAVLIQPDGKIVASGYAADTDNDYLAVRFNSNGSLDSSFSGDGIALVNSQQGEFAFASALQADNKIILAGQSYAGTRDKGLLLRLNTDGSVDSTYNGTGRQVINIDTFVNHIQGITLQNDGKVLAAGSFENVNNTDVFMARIDTSGAVDMVYAGAGINQIVQARKQDLNMPPVITTQADGKALLLVLNYDDTTNSASRSSMELMRFDTTGFLDNTFGIAGIARGYINQGTTLFRAIAKQTDGKLVVGGMWDVSTGAATLRDFVVARFNNDGTNDPSFGTGGKTSVNFGFVPLTGFASNGINSLQLQMDGKIVAGGAVSINDTVTNFGVTRLNPDGSLDNTFGNAGKQLVDFGVKNQNLMAVAVQPDGKIVLAGVAAFVGVTGNDICVARLNINGTLDSTFGTNGMKTIAVSAGAGSDIGRQVTVQPDGKILIAASVTQGGVKSMLLRLNANGTFDSSFNSTGKALLGWSTTAETITFLKVQNDGKILASGHVNGNTVLGTINRIAVARFNSNGTFDSSFNGNGKLLFSVNNRPSQGGALQVQQDGKIMLAGKVADIFSDGDFAFARLLPDGRIDSTFNNIGFVTIKTVDGDETVTGLALDSVNAYAVGYGNNPGTAGIIAAVTLGGMAFPLHLTQFVALPQNTDVHLNWTTASEQNTSYFGIERSMNGREFSSIGKVNAAVNSDRKGIYHYVDYSILSNEGISKETSAIYYRLRMVDKDGRFTYSEMKSIKLLAQNKGIAVYPNPVADVLNVHMTGKKTEPMTFKVLNIQGKTLIQQTKMIPEGYVQLQLNTGDLAAGTYILAVEGTERKVVEFIKQ